MQGQPKTRRLILGALVVMVAASTALGGAAGASAADATKRPDYGGKAGFKLECEALGGTFSEDGIGNTNCHWPDGGWTQCDANGNDCWYTPRQVPSGVQGPNVGTVIEVTTDVGGTVSPPTAGQRIAAPDDQKPAKVKHSKGKKGGKGRRK